MTLAMGRCYLRALVVNEVGQEILWDYGTAYAFEDLKRNEKQCILTRGPHGPRLGLDATCEGSRTGLAGRQARAFAPSA
jgi:hypothetical protein